MGFNKILNPIIRYSDYFPIGTEIELEKN